MERLTGRKEGGNAYIVGCPSFEIPKIIGLIIQNVVDRLAAYEDTGLEPENHQAWDFNEDAVLKLADNCPAYRLTASGNWPRRIRRDKW